MTQSAATAAFCGLWRCINDGPLAYTVYRALHRLLKVRVKDSQNWRSVQLSSALWSRLNNINSVGYSCQMTAAAVIIRKVTSHLLSNTCKKRQLDLRKLRLAWRRRITLPWRRRRSALAQGVICGLSLWTLLSQCQKTADEYISMQRCLGIMADSVYFIEFWIWGVSSISGGSTSCR